MSKEFELDAVRTRVIGDIESDLSREDVHRLRDNIGDMEGVNFNLDVEERRISAEIIDPGKSTESVKHELARRLEKTKNQGYRSISSDNISFSEERVETEPKEIEQDPIEVESIDNFWNRFQRYSEQLTEELGNYNPDIGQDSLSAYEDFLDIQDSATEYIIDNLGFSAEEFQFLLGNNNFTDEGFERLATKYRAEIEEDNNGSLWEEILEAHKENKNKRDSMVEEISSLADDHSKIVQAGSELRQGFQYIESEGDLPVGWEQEGGKNKLFLPMGSEARGAEEVLNSQIRKELNRYTTDIKETPHYTVLDLNIEPEQVYDSLKTVSEKLQTDLDFTFKSS